MTELWNLPYTSEHLESLHNFCYPPEPPPPPGSGIFVIPSFNQNTFFRSLNEISYDSHRLPLVIISHMQTSPVEIFILIMPFDKIPLNINVFYINKTYGDLPRKILEWRLQNNI